MKVTLRQAVRIAEMIEQDRVVTLWKPAGMDALPEGYIAGTYRLASGSGVINFGMDPHGVVST